MESQNQPCKPGWAGHCGCRRGCAGVGEDISKFGLGIKMMPSPGSEQGRGRSCADRVSDTTSAALSAKPGEQGAEFSSSQPGQESTPSARSFSRVGPATVG